LGAKRQTAEVRDLANEAGRLGTGRPAKAQRGKKGSPLGTRTAQGETGEGYDPFLQIAKKTGEDCLARRGRIHKIAPETR
jgi:hypothetical protein